MSFPQTIIPHKRAKTRLDKTQKNIILNSHLGYLKSVANHNTANKDRKGEKKKFPEINQSQVQSADLF